MDARNDNAMSLLPDAGSTSPAPQSHHTVAVAEDTPFTPSPAPSSAVTFLTPSPIAAFRTLPAGTVPPLFSQCNVRKHEYWQFAKLIAPASELPEGKKVWTTDDAIGIWCLKCAKALPYQKGSSQSIRYHMETKHMADLRAFRDKLNRIKEQRSPSVTTSAAIAAAAADSASSSSNGKGTKRKGPPNSPVAHDALAATDAAIVLYEVPSAALDMDIGTTSIVSADTANAPPAAIAPTTAPADSVSWVKNVQRRSGFWGNAYWYDLQLERRMPLAKPMLNEMIAALPPCDGKRVIDLCAGSGRASAALLAAYPTAVVTLVDSSSERLGIAQKRLMGSGVAVGTNAHFVTKSIAPGVSETISDTPVDIVVGCLALHVLAENPAHYQSNMQKGAAAQPAEKPSVETTYELIFRLIYNSLAPGGHLIFADHVGQLGLFAQLQTMARVGGSRMTGSIRAGAPEKFYRDCRGSDAALVGRTPPRAPPPLSIVGSRRNGIRGGFPGPRARPSVIFSSQQLGVTVGGCAAFYSAVLSCEPEHPVTICPGNLPACIRVSPSLLVFNREDWRIPQFFRVTVLASVHDDNNKDDRKLQVIEHVGSSMDSRFNGNKILYLPPTVLVQITGREGCYLFTSGNSLATITTSTTGDPKAKASFSSSTYHEFVQIELDAAPNPPQLSLQKVSVASAAGITNDALEAQDGVSALVSRRSSSRRNLTASASSASLAPSLQSLQSSSVDGYHHSTHRDGTALVKAVCRADHTLLLYKSGNWGILGTMHVDYSTEEQTLEADLIGVYGSRGSNSTLSRMLIDVECGDAHVVALTEQGYVMTWGEGKDGRLGHGKACSIRAPHVIKSLFHKRILHIACGARHSVAVAEDGDVFSWGDGKCGALGHGLNEHEQHFDLVNMPMEILSLKSKGVARVACGDMHTAVVLLDGSLLTCGWSANGRLGRNCPKKSEFSSVFELVDMKTRLCTFVVCGAAHTLVLTECNSVYGFGWNSSGQLGLGDRRTRGVPTKIQYFTTDDLIVVSLAAGKLHSMAMTQDARAFAWGSDELGQCGIGSFPQIYTVPHLVASTVGVSATQISAGESHSVMLTTASQKQLDALEVNHPSRYASLMESFELFVRRDRELQAKVLAFAKENEWKREAARRNRKPPIDSSFSLARTLQQELLGIENNNSAVSVNHRVCRPRTAGAVLSPRSSCTTAKIESNSQQRPITTSNSNKTVRCSSATLWRQARLFAFQPPPEVAEKATESPQKPRPHTVANGTQRVAAQVKSNRRPMSANISHVQPKLSAGARRALASMLNGDHETRKAQTASINTSVSPSKSSQCDSRGEKKKHESLVSFPLSRPKSAPSRAVGRKFVE